MKRGTSPSSNGWDFIPNIDGWDDVLMWIVITEIKESIRIICFPNLFELIVSNPKWCPRLVYFIS